MMFDNFFIEMIVEEDSTVTCIEGRGFVLVPIAQGNQI